MPQRGRRSALSGKGVERRGDGLRDGGRQKAGVLGVVEEGIEHQESALAPVRTPFLQSQEELGFRLGLGLGLGLAESAHVFL